MTLPKYRCHKEVRAMKIESISLSECETYMVLWGHVPGEEVCLPTAWYKEHDPEVGGYYIECDATYSPAEAFEAGYTLIEEDSK